MIALLQVVWRLVLMVLRVILFLALFLIAITNTAIIEFHWFLDRSVQIPLNLLLLGAFLLGLIITALAFNMFKLQRKN
ncbi:MAG: lipopolysaccharide assembly protein LapA domain-containing protein [Betaproteobacteria bacterium]|jgi:uncharacterized integral membrane protein